LAGVVPPDVLVEVSLNMLAGYGVVDVPDAVLHEREEPLDRVRMDISLT
jgi:hypothetical protein